MSAKGRDNKRRSVPVSNDHNLNKNRQDRPVTDAVRNVREKLTSASGVTFEFDRDIVLAHVRNYRAASLVIPILILFIGFISLSWAEPFLTMLWMVGALLAHAFLYVRNSHYLTMKPEGPGGYHDCRRQLIRGDLISGLVWATYFALPVEQHLDLQPVFAFSAFLIVIAVYSVTAAPIFTGMVLSTWPITTALVISFMLTGTADMMIMASLFAAAQLMFMMVGRQVQAALLSVFKIKAEKDDLILYLEEAKVLSEESKRRAEDANLAKSKFLATMSHELRTPLNAILGFSEIMQTEILGPLSNASYKEYVQDINSSGRHLLNLINEILDLSRVEAGKYELVEQPVNLLELVDDCQTLLQLRAKSKNVELLLRGEDNMPRLWADERALRQIVLNLLSNSLKFTPGGGNITAKVGWTSGGGQYVTISDTGPGIPEDEIETVLSQFGQGSLAIKSAEQGTGLGLPIVQALVHKHGGKFELKSKLRVGTQVTVTLPQSRVMEALAAIHSSKENAENRTTSSRERRRAS